MFKVRHACSSVGPLKPPGTSPSSGPPIGCGAAGENVVASRIPVHEVTGSGAANRAAVAYCTPRNTWTVLSSTTSVVPTSRPKGILISDIPGQSTTTFEYHFSNVTPNNGLPVGSLLDGQIAWRLSCPVQ